MQALDRHGIGKQEERPNARIWIIHAGKIESYFEKFYVFYGDCTHVMTCPSPTNNRRQTNKICCVFIYDSSSYRFFHVPSASLQIELMLWARTKAMALLVVVLLARYSFFSVSLSLFIAKEKTKNSWLLAYFIMRRISSILSSISYY